MNSNGYERVARILRSHIIYTETHIHKNEVLKSENNTRRISSKMFR